MKTMHIVGARLSMGTGRWQDGGVFVRDGVIVAVGPDDELTGLRDPRTEIVDARGRSLLAGFHDTHVHPSLAGAALRDLDLTTTHDAAEYLRMIAEYARAHPDEDVVRGSGWYGDVFPGGFPTRWMLDDLVPERPVVLSSHDGHGVWVNSRALEAAGILDDVSDPSGGAFLRDEGGRLTGILLDTAVASVECLRPSPTQESIEEALLLAQQRLHEVGVTTWHDAAVGESELGPDTFDAYVALDARGSLTGYVRLCQWWDRDGGLEQIDRLRERRDRVAGSRRLDASIVKIMQDGVIENHTGALLAPYSDREGFTGESFIEPHRLDEIVTALDADGFDVHMHAVGDRAVRECLDAVERARAENGVGGGRHQIAHLDVVDPRDAARFAPLGVSANVQMLWARADTEIVERKLPAMGAERSRHHFPFGSLHRAGARIVGGSDWPVSDPRPLWAIHTAAHRLAPAGDPHATGAALTDPLLPEEALPVAVGLDAYTGAAAWVGRREASSGALAAGLDADLVLLDRDIAGGTELDTAAVVATWIAGARVAGSADERTSEES